MALQLRHLPQGPGSSVQVTFRTAMESIIMARSVEFDGAFKKPVGPVVVLVGAVVVVGVVVAVVGLVVVVVGVVVVVVGVVVVAVVVVV